MTDRELMQQALEAMMTIRPYEVVDYDPLEASITALRERLAQPEQKQDSTCNKTLRAEGKGYPRTCRKCGKGPCIADRVQPEQEPVAWRYKIMPPFWTYSEKYPSKEFAGDAWDRWQVTPLYTTPPQRKPLTDEEIMNLCASEWASHPIEVARVIEAAHGIKEKNT